VTIDDASDRCGTRGPRAGRFPARLSAGLALSLLCVLLLAGGLLLWWLEVRLPSGREEIRRQQLELDLSSTARRLRQAARDGSLTDSEINGINKGSRWTLDRDAEEIRVSRLFAGPETEYQCWTFTLDLPLTHDTAVHRARGDTCPPR
jgi:hypothetical protein